MTSPIAAQGQEFEALVAPTRNALRAVLGTAREIRQRRGLTPAADAQAMQEISDGQALAGKDPWGDDPVTNAYSMVSSLLWAAEDHMNAILKLLDSEPPVYAQFVLSRVALDGCLLARWLLGGNAPNARNRVARLMNYRRDDLMHRAKLGSVGGQNDVEKASEDAALILEEGQRLDFAVVLSKKTKKPVAFEPVMPKASDLAENHFLAGDEELGIDGTVGVVMWRYWSGVVHSRWHALRQGIESAGGNPDSFTPGVEAANYVTRTRDTLQTLALLGLAYIPAVAMSLLRMGWEEQAWSDTATEFIQVVQSQFPRP
jgi:hypothetical protein